MAFNARGVTKNETKSENAVDYDALNKYVVETANLQERETLIGYVSSIVDLGLQEQEDAKVEFNGTAEDEASIIDDKPDTYFETGPDEKGNVKRWKRWPQKPAQAVAVSVDFPDIIVDKGQFFGNSKPLPLRLWMGGQFFIQGAGMVVGRPTMLKINKSAGFWSFDKKHLFHKMAVAAKLIKADEAFLPQNIDDLLGKAFQFQVQVFFKESKGKEYYTEYINFQGGLGRGQVAPEPLTEPFIIQFTEPNSVENLKEIRNHVMNTLKRAGDFEGSAIQAQLAALEGSKPAKQEQEAPKEATPTAPKPAAKAGKPAAKKAPNFDDMDSDIPF